MARMPKWPEWCDQRAKQFIYDNILYDYFASRISDAMNRETDRQTKHILLARGNMNLPCDMRCGSGYTSYSCTNNHKSYAYDHSRT